MAVTCPKCGSDKTQKRNIGTKIGGGVGGTAGGIGAVAGGSEGAPLEQPWDQLFFLELELLLAV